MALKCIINAPPPTLPAGMLTPGRLIKLLKAEKANTYASVPPPNTIVRVDSKGRGQKGDYVTLTDDDGRSFCALVDSLEAMRITKAEAAARKQALKEQLIRGVKPAYRCHGNTIGSDPEIFAVDERGEVVPAFAYLPPKDKRQQIDWTGSVSIYGGAYVFWDGFQAEWTTPCTTCIANMVDKVRAGMVYTLQAARKVNPKATLSPRCVLPVSQELLDTSPKEGVILGCAPSFNAYFEGVNPALEGLEPTQLPVRFAGFHVHIGCGQISEKEAKKIVKAIDRIAGLASVAAFRGLEDPIRRRYYGLAGEFRLPAHGLEYRVLSSVGLNHPVLTHLCFDLVRMGYSFGRDGYLYAFEATDAEVATAINDLNVELALELLNRNKPLLTALLRSGYTSHTSLLPGGENGGQADRAVAKALRLIFEGASGLLNVTDLTANWNLEGRWQMHSDRDRASLANWKFD